MSEEISQIGNYRIRAELGRGGMAIVYLAEDTRLRRDVALKVLPASLVNEQRKRRFLNEARAAARVSHPNVATVFEAGEAAGNAFIAMEYVEGRTLRAILQERGGAPLPMNEALRIARAIANGLESVHVAGIVHRDLKPENVMLTQSGLVKLLDFGLAKLAAASKKEHGVAAQGQAKTSGVEESVMRSAERLTVNDCILGTPSYMSPEQATGSPLDLRSDLFSLGVLLYEMLSGERPFRGNTDMEVLIAIARDSPEPASQRNPAVSAELDRLLSRCLAKKPEQRCEGAFEIRAAIDQLLGISRGSFTKEERAIISVVLVGTGAVSSHDAALAHLREELRYEVGQRGGRAEVLADGSFAATFAGQRIATDQAAYCARAALGLRRSVPSLPMALVMGWDEGAERRPPAELFRRAHMLLARSEDGLRNPALGSIASVAIDEMVAGLLGIRFDVRGTPEGPVLAGEYQIPEIARTLLGRPTLCVGRDRELATLSALFNECVEAPLGRVVLIVAPPGTGKSRLAHELIRILSRQRGTAINIWMSFGECQGAGSAFSMLSQALRAECGIRGDESLDERRMKLEGRVARSVPAGDRRRIGEFLGELIRVPFPNDDSVQLRAARQDAELMNEQMRRAFLDFVAAETARGPILFVLDDLQWGDLPTMHFIDAALRAHCDKPWLVLALARPEVHDRFPKLWATRDVLQIHLKELSRKASEQLVRQALGPQATDALVERLCTLSDGQAFYLEELIRAAALRPAEALPATVTAMVQARLMELGANERHLLRAASVFGETFWQSAVERPAGGATAELLSRLIEREIIMRRLDSQFPGEREYAFRHALLREGAYAMLTDADRVLGHRLAAEWLELHDGQNPLVIAEHFERGERALLAARFYRDAGDQALRAFDVDAAIICGERGLSCGATGSVRVRLLGILCEAHGWRCDYGRAEPIARELMQCAPRGSPAHSTAALLQMSVALFGGRFSELMEVVDTAHAAAPSPEIPGLLASMLMCCATQLPLAGLVERGAAYLAKLRKLCEDTGGHNPVLRGWLHFSCGFDSLGTQEDPWSALREVEAARECFAEAGDRKAFAHAQILVGMCAWFLGDACRAERELCDARATDQELPATSAHRSTIHVDVLVERGDLAGARRYAEALVEYGHRQQNRYDEGFGRYALSKVLHAAGDQDAAAREAMLAAELLPTPVYRLWPLSLLALIHLAQGRPEQACATARQGVLASESLQNFGYRGNEMRLAYALALAEAGDSEQAKRCIADASAKILATAARIGDPALRQSYVGKVPANRRILELARKWLHQPLPDDM